MVTPDAVAAFGVYHAEQEVAVSPVAANPARRYIAQQFSAEALQG
jgi:hypothetical protein